jgi:hypothetical protein
MWLRAPDELAGRPFWIIGLASLAVASTLRGDPAGTTGWGSALILAGGALFLSSLQQTWLNRLLLVGFWSISALPFSLTASGWLSGTGLLDWSVPVLIVAQALLLAGFVRHALRPSTRASLAAQPTWAKTVYPAGIGLLLLTQFVLGLWGWDGALFIGLWPAAVGACLLSLGLQWSAPRLALLNPLPAHWLQAAGTSRLDRLYQNLWGLYRRFGAAAGIVSDILEGEAGLMWTLLFLLLFVILIVPRNP